MILVVGYGYWGKILSKIIIKNGFSIDYIFTSNSKHLASHEGYLEVTKFLPYHMLFNILASVASRKSIFIFIASGPTHHFSIISSILPLLLLHLNIYIWCEKPFIISQDQYSCLTLLKSLFDSKRIFINYPYILPNLNPGISLDSLNNEITYRIININLFTKNTYVRPHSIELDFFPHLYLLLREIFHFTPQLLFEVKVLGKGIKYLFDQKLIDLHLLINSKEIHFNYGISTTINSIALTGRNHFNVYEAIEPIELDFKTLFVHNPVDCNVQKFLTQQNFSLGDLPLISYIYQEDVFDFSKTILDNIKLIS